MAAGSTYTPIATTTLGSAAASYTFSSIPSTYTDLVLIYSGSGSVSTDIGVQFNGDTGTNYSRTLLYGDGTSAASGRQSSVSAINMAYQTTGIQNAKINVMNYANTTTYKTAISTEAIPSFAFGAVVGLWRSTAAITSLTFAASSGTMSIGTTLSLYGIAAA